jgi:uncharacterized protein YecT (DUF1311 family)
MTARVFRAVLIGLIGIACVFIAPASAAERPSFDCSKASSPSEKAICGNDRLARLDRAIAKAFGELRKDADLAETLPKEQAEFLTKRDACASDINCLAREMESRRDALALEPLRDSKDERERFVGRYRSGNGDMMVRRTLAGDYALSGSSGDPNGRWSCDIWGNILSVRNGVATVNGEDDSSSEPLIVYLKLRGNVLVVTEDLDKPLAGRSCGANGTVEGRYKRVSRAR